MIDGDFFQSIAHVTWSDNMQLPDLKNIIMYAKTEDQLEAIEFIMIGGWGIAKNMF